MTALQIASPKPACKTADIETLRSALLAVRSSAGPLADMNDDRVAALFRHLGTALDVAERLAFAPPAAPAKRAKRLSDDRWPDYEASRKKLVWPAPSIVVQFAGGEKVRMSFASETGKPWNLAHALRVAVSAYRSRVRLLMTGGWNARTIFANELTIGETESFIAVPAIEACEVEQSGNVVHVVDCGIANDRTTALRSGTFELPALIGPTLPGVKEAVLAKYRVDAARVALAALAGKIEPEAMHRAFQSFEFEMWRISPEFSTRLQNLMDWRRSSDHLEMDLHRARRMAQALDVLEPEFYRQENEAALADGMGEALADLSRISKPAARRHERIQKAAEQEAVANHTAPVSLPDDSCLVWESEQRRRTAAGGAKRLVLKRNGSELGCAFKSASGVYRASAACGKVFINVEGDSMIEARMALELNLQLRAAELFGLGSISFREAA